MRKIIQVAAMPLVDGEEKSYPPSVIALADDGTIWESFYSFDSSEWKEWVQLPSIPQS
jgi:hypothetical protein